MDRRDQRFQAGFGAIKCRVAGAAQIEAIVDVVADRLVAGVGPAGRGSQELTVAGVEQIGHPVFDCLVARLEELQDCRRRDIGQDDAVLQPFQSGTASPEVPRRACCRPRRPTKTPGVPHQLFGKPARAVVPKKAHTVATSGRG